MTDGERPWAQATLALGGVCWLAWTVAIFGTGTTSGAIHGLVGLSGLVLAVGLLGVVLRLPWTYKFPGGEGSGIAMLGGLGFAAGHWLAALLSTENGPVEAVIALGVLGLVGGTLLLAVGILRARRTPPWLGVALLVGTVLFVGFGDGSGLRALLALPLGLAWLATGGYLLRFPEQPSGHLEPSAISR